MSSNGKPQAPPAGCFGVNAPDLLRHETLPDIFAATVARFGHRTAVIESSQAWTYTDLNQAAARIARQLQSKNIGPGDCVGLFAPRSFAAYAGLLGILKAGAAYVPLDPSYPSDRVAWILSDVSARAVLTTAATHLQVDHAACSSMRLDDETELPREEIADSRASSSPTALPSDRCYVIYTSGTTGRPKGVELPHQAVCHLVRAEQQLFPVTPDDRVFQGFSLAFDASVEELWLAWSNGAALVVGTDDILQAGPTAMPRLLTESGVTILSCVPTLLSMLEETIPTLRLLILGGEVCPPDLVRRWWQPDLRIVNSYGPTEATVIATAGDYHPDLSVTIGRPLPNYRAYVLDAQQQPVAGGDVGELYLGGPSIALGYVNRPELTASRFLSDPWNPGWRMYRTGDLARLRDDGCFDFCGRADTQVKIRGYRVELAEIEQALLEQPGISAAVVGVREDTPGLQQLAAYVIAASGAAVDFSAVRESLKDRLPPYMIPAWIERLEVFPRLTSGKVDRTRLPAPSRVQQTLETRPDNPTAGVLWDCWTRLFAPLPVRTTDNFFLDLGGHSLLAARMVSELRRTPEFHDLSMIDVYHHPTIDRLTTVLELRRLNADSKHTTTVPPVSFSAAESVEHASWMPLSWRHWLCGLGQFVALYPLMGLFALQWLAPYLTYSYMHDEEYSVDACLIGAFASLLIVYPTMIFLACLGKWLIIGRIKPGKYPLWGLYYFRFWLANQVVGLAPTGYLIGTPLLPLFYRCLGARIGRNVYLGTDQMSAFDLLVIGSDSSIGSDTAVQGYFVKDGWLNIGGATIGAKCFIGNRCAVSSGCRLEDRARLEDLSHASEGGRIPAGETWRGSPAQSVERPEVRPVGLAPTSRRQRFAFGAIQTLGVVLIPLFFIGAILPGMILMVHLNAWDDWYYYLFLSPLVALLFVITLCLEILVLKWLLLGRVQPGVYPLYCSFHLRKWSLDQLLELSLDFVGPLYSTLYLNPWYRALGARLGRRVEISTASFISPDLLELGDGSFIADAVSLGAAHVEDGELAIGRTLIGRRTFIGNSALLAPDTVIGDNALIGCLSKAPSHEAVRGTDWLGSPPFSLPRRHQSSTFGEETTFSPTRSLIVQRGIIEFFRVLLPATCFIALTHVLLSAVLMTKDYVTQAELLAIFPIYCGISGFAACAIVAVLKWSIMGRYRPAEHPLWSRYVWLNELVTAMYENLACVWLLDTLAGTPFLPWYLRTLGCRIGRRCYLATTWFTEFDLVRLGDDVQLNADVTVQTHLFEDRVMKQSYVQIDDGCHVGEYSLVLYDTHMAAGSSLGGLSLLMKNESLPADTQWQGIPARHVIVKPLGESSRLSSMDSV